MDLTFSKEYEIIPEWKNNANDANPIKVNCKYLTQPEFDKCMKTDIYKDDEGIMRVKVYPVRENYIKFGIKSIDNFKLNGEQIKTGDDLLRCQRVGGLINELVNKIMDKENEGRDDIKN